MSLKETLLWDQEKMGKWSPDLDSNTKELSRTINLMVLEP
jgi:hypothetical protein